MRSFLLLLILVLFMLCSSAVAKDNELKIYCGTTMYKAMMEIKVNFEKKHGCIVNIVPGASGDMKMMFMNFKDGDMYFPGDESFISSLEKDNPGYIVDKKHVGNNMAVLIVKKGNPKNINSLDDLTRSDLKIVLGHPERGSIGKLTSVLLKKKGIFEKVMKKEKTLETESINLMNAITNKDYDVTINWNTLAILPEYSKPIDVLQIPGSLDPSEKLVLAVLKTSKNVDLAKELMNYSVSPAGKEVFARYGLK